VSVGVHVRWFAVGARLQHFQKCTDNLGTTVARQCELQSKRLPSFRPEGACPASLPERTFRDYYATVGANVQDANNQNLPFAVGTILPGKEFIGTYYRKPVKCCVSMLNADRSKFTSELTRRLNLRGGRAVQIASKKNMIIFKPAYANRLISIDGNSPDKGGQNVVANICQTDFPRAEAEYQRYAN
jgi:hypothetical protein